MIVAAGLLWLLGLALFVAGLVTGVPAFYWGCVAACLVAAGLLVAAQRAMRAGPGPPAPADRPVAPEEPPADLLPGAGSTAVSAGPAPAEEPASIPGPAPVGEPAATAPAADPPVTARPPDEEYTEPPVEEVEVTDLLIIVDLTDEVLVVDERPRYHVPGCAWLRGESTIPLPLDEARADGFTPCGACRPDHTFAERARARRAAPDG
ncbi:hypothetical protein [Blastococcus montanus]|uniref:hypothetical protein n=1 Tax=Blastococcus montanus TaxID=3144973 RepID=UPI00320A248B